MSEFLDVDGSAQLNVPASIADDAHVWLQYGDSDAQEPNVLFTNEEDFAENGVSIGVRPYTVTVASTIGEYKTIIYMAVATISGHYSCKGSTGYNKHIGQMGEVEVDFDAGS